MRDLLRGKLTELDERMRMMREFRRTLAQHLAACEKELEERGSKAQCSVLVNLPRSDEKGSETMKSEKLALGGAMAAAFGAALCCIGPVLFALLGLGAFSAASVFQSLRPYLLAVAVLALAFGFYRVYFRREECAPGAACATKPVSKVNRAALWVALFVVTAFALSPYYIGYIATAVARQQQTAPGASAQSGLLETVTVAVEG